MKLIFDDGKQIELEKVQNIGEGDIIIRLKVYMHEADIYDLEKKLTKKFDRKVIILDARCGEIYTVPPNSKVGISTRGPLGGD